MMKLSQLSQIILRCLLGSSIMLAGTSYVIADELDNVLDYAVSTNKISASSQARINKTVAQTDKLLQEYLEAKESVKNGELINRQKQEEIQSQSEQKVSLLKQLKDVELVQRDIVPLMRRMVNTLDEFIKLDVPFLPEERRNRIVKLKKSLVQADLSVSDKYRQILEAYQVEINYGSSIEAYRGEILLGEEKEKKVVDFFRIGRVALYYQTLNREQVGRWNQQTGAWESLSDDYRTAIQRGIRMAKRQIAPDLLELAIPAPTKADAQAPVAAN